MMDQIVVPDTIYALSSGALPSGVAIIRLSGPRVREVLTQMIGSQPPARKAVLRDIRGRGGILLDRGIVLFFPAPSSFTGEDCGEFHLHGGRAVIAAVLNALKELPGLRAAEAGEFTKRAFFNGKMDLTGAEALSDLIAAETEAQRRFALQNSTAEHRKLYGSWREKIIRVRAMIEAELDFVDESDVPDAVSNTVWKDLERLRGEIVAHAEKYHAAEIIRDGFEVVIVGAPNAGKSTLLNALARRDVAIVTDEPGTTRDILEVSLDIAGIKTILADTAGIREAEGKVEAIGIERTLDRARDADLILLLEDLSAPQPTLPDFEGRMVRIGTKSDLISSTPNGRYDCVISAETGAGLERLLEILRSEVEKFASRVGETLPFRLRHVTFLTEATEALLKALQRSEHELELRAEHLREASNALGRIIGDVDTEDLLDEIFSTFCIGK